LAAQKGLAEAQFFLALLYRDGDVVPKNIYDSDRWLKLASVHGLPEAQFILGCRYFYGDEFLANDQAKAVELFRQAAEAGHPFAQHNLGVAYQHGLGGLPVDAKEAVKLFLRAAEQDAERAKLYLGQAYDAGEGVEKNRAEALKWFRSGASQGDLDSLTRLAALTLEGVAGPDKVEEGLKLYFEAAELGHFEAILTVATFYETGEYLPQDFAEALKWYLKVANKDIPELHRKLSNAYHHMTPQNPVESLKWLQKAAQGEHDEARLIYAWKMDKNAQTFERQKESLESHRSSAEKGDAAAQYALAFFAQL
jgi:TPR repeat protein